MWQPIAQDTEATPTADHIPAHPKDLIPQSKARGGVGVTVPWGHQLRLVPGWCPGSGDSKRFGAK
jgi:hypothetical protein